VHCYRTSHVRVRRPGSDHPKVFQGVEEILVISRFDRPGVSILLGAGQLEILNNKLMYLKSFLRVSNLY